MTISIFLNRDELYAQAVASPAISQPNNAGPLIYGELLNPDSLGDLRIVFTPYYFAKRHTARQEEIFPKLESGTFFDGVVDPRAKKFLVQAPSFDRPIHFSVLLGKRKLLDNYILFPGDSIKISINLQDNFLMFGGPDGAGLELQYQLDRLKHQKEFELPRTILTANPEAIFTEKKYRDQWEAQKTVFGARLEFEELNKDVFDKKISELERLDSTIFPYLALAEKFGNSLTLEKKDLILLELYGSHYHPLVYSFYVFYFSEMPRFFNEKELKVMHERTRSALVKFPGPKFSKQAQLVSSTWMDMELARLCVLSLIENKPFLDILNSNHSGEVADRLATAFLTKDLGRYPDPKSILSQYLAQMKYSPWKDKVLALKSATVPGEPIIDLELEDLKGDKFKFSKLFGRPTIIYYYFSTCTFSARYFKEMLFPLYEKTAKAMGVDLIAVSVDEDRNLWLAQLDEFSDPSIPTYRMFGAPKKIWYEHYAVRGYPKTIFIDSAGIIKSFGLSRKSYGEFESDFLKVVKGL
ncbi:Peroxiredoxin [Pedobacter insulae]|uniref:Peroxiredoxin n=2 Tax=Pedobacter insulae TaxID=414048 RepID=A0A1I3AM26_9SPHI|nr:Peroxiredoxin [Pedobacter insulae]